jgi:hypothetical protein
MDSLPREDISPKINSDFLRMMGDTNWKSRKETLDQVEGNLVNFFFFVF